MTHDEAALFFLLLGMYVTNIVPVPPGDEVTGLRAAGSGL